jgi:hypothetical protein
MGRRQASAGPLRERRVAKPAIDTKLAGVVLVAERDRLGRRVIENTGHPIGMRKPHGKNDAAGGERDSSDEK